MNHTIEWFLAAAENTYRGAQSIVQTIATELKEGAKTGALTGALFYIPVAAYQEFFVKAPHQNVTLGVFDMIIGMSVLGGGIRAGLSIPTAIYRLIKNGSGLSIKIDDEKSESFTQKQANQKFREISAYSIENEVSEGDLRLIKSMSHHPRLVEQFPQVLADMINEDIANNPQQSWGFD